jgi:hypothetical protein
MLIAPLGAGIRFSRELLLKRDNIVSSTFAEEATVDGIHPVARRRFTLERSHESKLGDDSEMRVASLSRLMRLSRGFVMAIAAVVAAGSLAALPTAAKADVTWFVTGTFSDGGTVDGTFNINAYGYLSGYDLLTTGGDGFSSFDYTEQNSYFSNGAFYVDAQPDYQQDLHLEFVGDLSIPVANNPIVGGDQGPSYECQGSFGCYVPTTDGALRYITSGFASAAVPEPAIWAMMLAGFGGLGMALRGQRRKFAAA